MQRGGAPEHVVRDPAGVVAQLMVVGVLEERVPVGGVDGEEADDAADQQVEGRRTLAGVDGKANRSCEEQDVAERVGDRDTRREHEQP